MTKLGIFDFDLLFSREMAIVWEALSGLDLDARRSSGIRGTQVETPLIEFYKLFPTVLLSFA